MRHFTKVTEKDVDLIYRWSNDAETRKNSLVTTRVDYENHVKWFKAKVADPGCFFFILYHDDDPVAQLRIQVENNGMGRISYSVAREYRERGYGAYLCNAVVALVKEYAIPVHTVFAELKKENLPIVKIYNRSMYDRKDAGDVYVFEKRVGVVP